MTAVLTGAQRQARYRRRFREEARLADRVEITPGRFKALREAFNLPPEWDPGPEDLKAAIEALLDLLPQREIG